MRTKTERPVFTWHSGATGEVETENGSVSARLVPYSIPDDRPGDWKGKRYTSSVYEPGCFDAWIAEHGTRRTKFMFDHGDAQLPLAGGSEHGTNALPIGTMISMESHDDGLYFEAAFSGSDLAQNVRELATSGGLTDVSFASHVVTADVRADGYRHVTECEVWDASIVVWGQFLENAAIVEVNRREASHMGGVSTCGAMLEGAVYECVTDLFLDWRQDGVITGPEFVALSEAATRILSAVQGEIPDDIAARECDDDGFDWWHRAADRHKRTEPEFDYRRNADGTWLNPDPSDTNKPAPRETHAGAAINKQNADALNGVASGMREMMANMETHAATVERIVSEGAHADESHDADLAADETSSQDRRFRLAEFEGYLMDDAPVPVTTTE